MVELVYTTDSKPVALAHVSSTLTVGTFSTYRGWIMAKRGTLKKPLRKRGASKGGKTIGRIGGAKRVGKRVR